MDRSRDDRFIVEKDEERSEVKVQEGPEGFPFLKYEKYIFKYSFRAEEGMKVNAVPLRTAANRANKTRLFGDTHGRCLAPTANA